jgi:hypothetical protein
VRSGGALPDGVLPVLETDVAAEQRMVVIRDVASGKDATTLVWRNSSTTTPLST